MKIFCLTADRGTAGKLRQIEISPRRMPRMSADTDRRIEGAVSREPAIEIIVDGHSLRAFPGESVAVALLAAGKRVLRTTARHSEPRGLYCGIGICFDCVMVVDGQPNVRACQTRVRPGMRIEMQLGHGMWRVKP